MSASHPYQDSTLSDDIRIADLLGRMTLTEKVAQMMQLPVQYDHGVNEVVSSGVGSILHASPEKLRQANEAVKRTRLQIPLLVGEDCIHGHSFWEGATIFPTQLGMAASWNPDLLWEVARVTAIEVAPTGIHWTFSPVLCIARELRWGRVGETFGEDPHLLGVLGEAMIEGYQGEGLDDPNAILATSKHFAAYSETLGGRDASEADISQRKMRSWFLPPFERVARAGSSTFMLGYQSTDGIPITVNEWLLNQVLREEWGYEGMLVTDWDNVGHLVRETRLFSGFPQASSAAVGAGNDMIMSTPQFLEAAVEAVNQGLLSEAQIDGAVARILRVKFELGLFENPRLPDEAAQVVIGSDAHTAFNLKVARQSLVLLRNEGLLPLAADTTGVLVTGPNADDPDATLGDWAGSSGQADWLSHGHPRGQIVTVLDGLRAQAPAGTQISVAPGAGILTLDIAEGETFFADGQPRPQAVIPTPADPAEVAAAVTAAQKADVTVVVVGDRIELVGEGRSTATLELVGGQIALIDALAQAEVPFVLVVLASKPLVLPPSAEKAGAVIWAANPGMQGGRAVAELIYGQIEPTGRLPISWPRHVGQQPVYYNVVNGQHGDRYADLTQDPAWVFGEGLSYTTIEYSDLEILTPNVKIPRENGSPIQGAALGAAVHSWRRSADSRRAAEYGAGTVRPISEGCEGSVGGGRSGSRQPTHPQASGSDSTATVRARVRLTNTGSRDAVEVVQGYIRDLVASATWANKELKAFERVCVAAGESRIVELELPAADCSIVNAAGERVVEPGEFELLMGPSSRDSDLLAGSFRINE